MPKSCDQCFHCRTKIRLQHNPTVVIEHENPQIEEFLNRTLEFDQPVWCEEDMWYNQLGDQSFHYRNLARIPKNPQRFEEAQHCSKFVRA